MDLGLYPLASGSLALIQRMDVLANNLANADTAGYKADRSLFRSYMNAAMLPPVPISGADEPFSRLPSIEEIRTDFSQGAIKETGHPLDLSLEGEGFFVVNTSQGVKYTRQGNFYLDPQGVLVNGEKLPLLGTKGPIRLPSGGGNLVIDSQGKVFVGGTEVDVLRIADFPTPYPLQKEGNGLFGLSDPKAAERSAKDFKLHQGSLELSNVSLIRGLTDLISISRSYEAYQKAIDQLIGPNGASSKAANRVGTLA